MLGPRLPALSCHSIFICLALIPSLGLAQPITFDWSRRLGGAADDASRAVAVDNQGNVLITGLFRAAVDFGGGPIVSEGLSDIFLLKLDTDGAFVSASGFGSTGDDVGIGLGVDGSGNTYLAGSFSGSVDFGGEGLVSSGANDIFLASFTADGTHRWSKRFGTTRSEVVYDLAVASNGATTLVGSFVGTIDFGGGPFTSGGSCSSAFVARFDNSGAHEWSVERFGACADTIANYQARAVAMGSSGACFVAMNRFVCFADCERYGAIEEFDASGNSMGAFSWCGSTTYDVAIDADGYIYATGTCGDPDEFSLYWIFVKYSPMRNVLWTRIYEPEQQGLSLRSVSTNIDGSVLVTGSFEGTQDFGDGPMTSAGGRDIFAVRIPSAGAPPRSQRIGGTGTDSSGASAGATAGTFFLAGEFAGTTDVGGQPLTSAGGTDALVAKIRFPTQVAVAISEFRATSVEGVVTLESRFRSDLGVVAVNVYRAMEAQNSPSRIARVPGDGGDHFHFVDRNVGPGNSYRYQIGVVDADGEFFSPIATVSVDAIKAELAQNSPNPFNPTTTIRFVLSETERVLVSIFDGNGKRVCTLLDGVRSYGPHEITWDGRDDEGASVSSGVYFYRLTAGAFTESKKMVLLK